MPNRVGIVATILCGVLIAAHFLRADFLPLVALGLMFPGLLFIERPWAVRIVQLLLLLSAGEWIHALLTIATQRLEAGQPWMRMAWILGGVCLLNIGAAVMIRRPRAATK